MGLSVRVLRTKRKPVRVCSQPGVSPYYELPRSHTVCVRAVQTHLQDLPQVGGVRQQLGSVQPQVGQEADEGLVLVKGRGGRQSIMLWHPQSLLAECGQAGEHSCARVPHPPRHCKTQLIRH